MTKLMIAVQESVYIVNAITDQSTLEGVLDAVNSLIDEYGIDAQITFDSGYESIDERIVYDTFREETDLEYKQRTKREARQEKREREEYERLKAKFENGA
jgi:hypothetical protein